MASLEDIAQRMWSNLISRPSGQFGLRFLIQPAVAAVLAIRDGLKDASTGHSPYFWAIVTRLVKRRQRVREGFAATWKVIVMAVLIDAVYQVIELETFHPGEATIVAVLVAIIPYPLIRGPTARVAGQVAHSRCAT
jgi:hypothetical protein